MKEAAPRSVQNLRKGIRQHFYRGVDKFADRLIDELLVWVLDDAFKGRLTRSEAAEQIGLFFAEELGSGKPKSARLVKQR